MQILELSEEVFGSILTNMLKRSPDSYPREEAIVADIIKNVRERGDKAVFEYTKNFDKAEICAGNFIVTPEEEAEAYEKVDKDLIEIIKRAIARIRAFHEHEKQESWFTTENGMVLGQRVTPLQRAGVYVPGGKAAYPSSVLMNVIPAQVAGVPEIVMCTPPGKDGKITPTTLVAAKEAGVGTIYKVGGAQAIAAMAYGTESLKKVDKITGPGNIFVALAKKAVYGHVSIDSVAGPSEVTVLADDTADAHYVAADLMLEELAQERPNDLNVLLLRAAAQAGMGSNHAARRTLEKAMRAHPRSHLPYYNLANLLLDMGESVDTARQYYEMGRSCGGPQWAPLERRLNGER